MLNPPLFIELTIYQTNVKEMVLLSHVHGFSRDETDSATSIKTFIENGMVVAWVVKERPEEILRKAFLVTKSFLTLQVTAARDVQDTSKWDDEDGEDEIKLFA